MRLIAFKPHYCILLVALFLASCQKPMIEIKEGTSDFSTLGLIPMPLTIEEEAAHGFPIYKDTYIKTSDSTELLLQMAQFTAEKIFQHSGLSLDINPLNPSGTAIELELIPNEETEGDTTESNLDPNTTGEAYSIWVGKNVLKIASAQ